MVVRRSASPHAICLVVAAAFLAADFEGPLASDHGDAPQSVAGPRADANLTDLYAFTVGSNLVLALATNPAIAPSATSYLFPMDVTFEINIDVDSAVSPDDPLGDGGTITDPGRIREEITYRIRFLDDGSARLQQIRRRGTNPHHMPRRNVTRAASVVEAEAPNPVSDAVQPNRAGQGNDPGIVGLFTGLRDDPFIRGPRQGRNVAAIVLEVPLAAILRGQSTLLIWATSQVEELEGPHQELVGRALKSMFPENAALNALHPRHHLDQTGITPDVMIYDTALPAAYPNGRALADDVVDLVGDPRVLANDAPFPSTNDRLFLSEFPYLAPPHPAP